MFPPLNDKAFDWQLGKVESWFMKGLVHAGKVVGAIMAQSIGKAAMQMMLNTFHYAGEHDHAAGG